MDKNLFASEDPTHEKSALYRQFLRKYENVGAHFTAEALNEELLIHKDYGHAEVRESLENVYLNQNALAMEFVDARSDLKAYSKDPVSIFLTSMELGLYPPPEVMFCLQNALLSYLNRDSSLTLEQAFFGKLGKGRNSYSTQAKADSKYAFFDDFIKKYQSVESASASSAYDELHERRYRNNPNMNLEQSNKRLDQAIDDKEAFLKGYQRWKKQSIRRGYSE